MPRKTNIHFIERYYWIIPILLWVFQAVFTFNSLNQIRYEELAESVRNPFWFHNHLVYDGISSNIGWYGLLDTLYNLFGFNLFTAKFVRLGLQLISLICLAAVLKRFLGPKLAFIPLLAIGLSPTLFYFNTLQTSYGTDLQYLPIILFLITKSFPFLAWFLIMLACLSYPTFIFYLPALILFYVYQKPELKKSLISLGAFLLPLLLSFIYIKNNNLLIFDPVVKSGLFRGAGQLSVNTNFFSGNLELLLAGLFNHAAGYYDELKNVEFSHFFPILSLIIVFVSIFKLAIKDKKNYLILGITAIVFLANFIFVSFSSDPNFGVTGIRRYTPILASLYVFFTLSWSSVLSLTKRDKVFKNISVIIMVFLPLHHLLAFPGNLENLKRPSPYADFSWFSQAETPDKSLDLFVKQIGKQDLKLACSDKNQNLTQCRYSEIYPAVAGSCLWNKLPCHQILGFDQKSKDFILLSVDLWDKYYFGH